MRTAVYKYIAMFTDQRFLCRHDKNAKPKSQELSTREVVTLVAGVLFFAAFFAGMAAQVKARLPLHRYVAHFIRKNQVLSSSFACHLLL